MTALRDAVSELLEAQERFFDAFEDAVVGALAEPERLAVKGSDHSDERGDRLSLLWSIMRHTQALRDCLLEAEEDEAQQLAEAWVKVAASDIAAKIPSDATNHSQENAGQILATTAAISDPDLGRVVAAL
jgi:hypothetical protein